MKRNSEKNTENKSNYVNIKVTIRNMRSYYLSRFESQTEYMKNLK